MKTGATNAPRTPRKLPGKEFARRQFLKVSAAGVAGAFSIGALGSSKAFAQRGEPGSDLKQEFEDAAEEFGVPVGVLIAMGYVNTRWEMPPPDASDYEEEDPHGWGGYGIMALVRNPSTDTLSEAAELTGISEKDLKRDRRSNIRGGAALLAESQKKQGRSVYGRNQRRKTREQEELSSTEASGWLESVSGRGAYRALGTEDSAPAPAGVGGGEVYAEQVAQILKSGVSDKTELGERIRLQAQKMVDDISTRAGGR